MLGASFPSLHPSSPSPPPPPASPQDCYGDEAGLHRCERNAWGYHDCKHDQDVYLKCSNYPECEWRERAD